MLAALVLLLWQPFQGSTVLSGSVVDVEGLPLAGAAVRLETSSSDGPVAIITGIDGRFILVVRPHQAKLVFSKAGFAPVARDFLLPRGQILAVGKVALRDVLTLQGFVVGQDGTPVEGATVYLCNATSGVRSLLGHPGSALDTMKTGSDGFFSVEADFREKIALEVWAEEHLPKRLENPGLSPGQLLEIQLDLALTFRGQVVNEDGDGVAGALLRVSLAGQPGYTGTVVYANLNGEFEASSLAPGRYDIFVLGGDKAPLEQTEELAKDSGPVLLELLGGRTISGTVLDSRGEPVSGALVTVQEYSPAEFAPEERTSQDGGFLLQGLARGEVKIQVQHPRYPTLSRLVVVDEDVVGLNVFMEGGSTEVTGFVVDENRRPVRGVGLSLLPPAGGFLLNAVTDGQGFFRFRDVPPGEYIVSVSGSDFIVERASGQVSVESPTPLQLEVAVTHGASVQGQLVGLSGASLAEIRVMASNGSESRVGSVAKDGRYSVQRLLPGRWTILATTAEKAGSVVLEVGVGGQIEVAIMMGEPARAN